MLRIQKISCVVLIGIFSILISCNSNDDEYIPVEVSPVVADLSQVPYPKLSDYKFFTGEIKNLNPAYGVIPYKPTSELFSDYATKKRFVWLPNNTKATYDGDENVLNLPVGSALIKNFYYTNVQPNNTTKIIETRVMIRKQTGWIFAEYIWNNEQTEAFLETQNTETVITFLDENSIEKTVTYLTPNTVVDCKRCHSNIFTNEVKPIGIKPQNLNSNFTYTEGAKNQLNKLIEFGYLENNLPPTIVSVVNYKDTSKPINLRVRSYFDSNCAHCHQDGGEMDHNPIRFAFNETIENENMGVGLQAEHFLVGYTGRIVSSGNVGQSILHYRINTETDITYRMPPIGRNLRDELGVQLVADWINSL